MSKELLGSLELNRIYQFNCLDGLKLLPDNSIDTCVTSPPYWGLRDYGVEGQLGLEQTPQDYVQNMVNVFREVKRVLRDDGTLWLNLGDSYAANRSYQVSQSKHKALDYGSSNVTKVPEGLKPKDLVGIPWRVAFALQADGWYLRSDIIWHKPNVMPESVKDRPTKAHEYLFLLTKSEKYHYDADSIREPLKPETNPKPKGRGKQEWAKAHIGSPQQDNSGGVGANPLGRNKRTVWNINTKPFKGAHFAVFPMELVEPCILAGSPEDGVVLDPFMGSGTTGVVAKSKNRKFIGFELNPEYIQIANIRLEAEFNENDESKKPW